MDFIQIKAGENDVNRRLDRVLRKALPELPLGEIYRHIRKGTIKVNGKKTSQDYHIQQDDVLYLASFLPVNMPDEAKHPENVKIIENDELKNNSCSVNSKACYETVFCNEHIKVINKPAGISVHESKKGETSLAELISEEYKLKNSGSLSFTAGPLHRLDKNTSGILCFSQSIKGAQWFSENLSLIKKEYLGIVQGCIEEPQYWVDLIDDTPDEKAAFKTVRISNKGKEARTRCTPLAHGAYNGIPLVLCRFCIETGRKHQIRAQSAFHGVPLFGDSAYNDFCHSHTEKNAQGFFLHAARLSVPSNPINLPLLLEAPLPEKFQKFLKKAGISYSESQTGIYH